MINPNDSYICPNCGKDSGYMYSRGGQRPICFDCNMTMIRKPEMWAAEDHKPTRRFERDEITRILDGVTQDYRSYEVTYYDGAPIWSTHGADKELGFADFTNFGDLELYNTAPAIIRQLLEENAALTAINKAAINVVECALVERQAQAKTIREMGNNQ